MAKVLFLVAFQVKPVHREAFLEAARRTLKPWWESHGVARYEVYDEIGPTGPTGRVVQAYEFEDRAAYLRMRERDDPDLPREPYRWLFEPEFRVLERTV
jgi:hypothetical protein